MGGLKVKDDRLTAAFAMNNGGSWLSAAFYAYIIANCWTFMTVKVSHTFSDATGENEVHQGVRFFGAVGMLLEVRPSSCSSTIKGSFILTMLYLLLKTRYSDPSVNTLELSVQKVEECFAPYRRTAPFEISVVPDAFNHAEVEPPPHLQAQRRVRRQGGLQCVTVPKIDPQEYVTADAVEIKEMQPAPPLCGE